MALQQQRVTEAYTRNQHFESFGFWMSGSEALPYSHRVHPLSCSFGGWQECWACYQIFKKGGLDRISIFREVTFLGEGGCSFYVKIKLKSEIFNDKKSYKQKCFPFHS